MNRNSKEQKQRYISLQQAAVIYGCTQRHLNLMARRGKLRARKIGRNWVTTFKWLEEYSRSLTFLKPKKRKPKKIIFKKPSPVFKKALTTCLIFFLLFVLISTGFVIAKEKGFSLKPVNQFLSKIISSDFQSPNFVSARAFYSFGKTFGLVFHPYYEKYLASVFDEIKIIDKQINQKVNQSIWQPLGVVDITQTIAKGFKRVDRVSNQFFGNVFTSIYQGLNKGLAFLDELFTKPGQLAINIVETTTNFAIDAFSTTKKIFAHNLPRTLKNLLTINFLIPSYPVEITDQSFISIKDLYKRLSDIREMMEGRKIFIQETIYKTVKEVIVTKPIEVQVIKDEAVLADWKAGILSEVDTRLASLETSIYETTHVENIYYYTEAAKAGGFNTVNNEVDFNEDVDMNKNLTVVGSVTVGNNLSVTGTSAFAGTATFGGAVNISGDINIDSGVLFVDSINNYVGINTTIPTVELSVIGTANISQDLLVSGSVQFGGGEISTVSYSRFGATGTTHSLANAYDLMLSGMFEVDNSAWFDSTVSVSNDFEVGSNILFVDSNNGYVGIGTNIPSTELSIIGTASISQDLWASGSFQFGGGEGIASQSYSRLGSTSSTHALLDADDLLINGLLEVDDIAYFDSIASVAGNFYVDSNNDLFFIDATNDFVGIGTMSPDVLLDVYGSARFNNELVIGGALQVGNTTSVSYSRFGDSITDYGSIVSASSDLLISDNLEVDGQAWFDSNVSVSGKFEALGDVDLGTSTTNILVVNSYVGSNLIPENNNYDIGTSDNRWVHGYFDEITVATISAVGSALGGTTTSAFLINSDNASNDAEDSFLTFERGAPTTNASLKWDYTNTRFDLNFPLNIQSALLVQTQAQFAGTTTESYSRFGTNTTNYVTVLTQADDLLISGDLEIDGSAFLDQGVSLSGGNLDITGNIFFTGASIIDADNTLSINTTNNQAITTGAGLFTIGNDLTVGNDLAVTNNLTVGGTITADGVYTSDSIDFDEIVDSATLDADWVISGDYSIQFVKGSVSEMFESLALKTDTLSNSSGTLTINAFTLGGDVTGTDYSILDLNTLSANTLQDDEDDTLTINDNLSITDALETTSYIKTLTDLIVGSQAQFGGTTSVSYSRFGTGDTGHGLTDIDDLLITGMLEVDGSAYFDGTVSFEGISSSSVFYAQDGSAGAPSYTFSSDINTGMYLGADNELTFSTDGTERLRIDNTGLVGIGTINPFYTLSVDGTASISDSLFVLNDVLTVSQSFVGINTTDPGGLLNIQDDDSTTNLFAVSSASDGDYFVVKNDGYVGIGTTAPARQLDIGAGNFRGFWTDLVIGQGYGRGQIEIYDTAKSGLISFEDDVGLSLYVNDGGFIYEGLVIKKDSVVINAKGVENSYDVDFRVETLNELSALFVEGSSGNVGINDISPAARFEVVASTSINDYALMVSDEDGSAGDLFTIASTGYIGIGDITPGYKLSVDGTASISDQTFFMNDVLVVASNSYVGIGTTDPSNLLHLSANQGTAVVNYLLELESIDDTDLEKGDGVGILFKVPYNNSSSLGASIQAVKDCGTETCPDADLTFSAGTGGSLYEGMRIVGDTRNVGIGDTNPGYKLSVDGTASISDSFYVMDNLLEISNASASFGGTGSTSFAGDLDIEGDVNIGNGDLQIDASGNVVTIGGSFTDGTMTIDGSGNITGLVSIDNTGTLSINTTNNQAITTGTGLFTIGNDLTVTNNLTVGGTITADGVYTSNSIDFDEIVDNATLDNNWIISGDAYYIKFPHASISDDLTIGATTRFTDGYIDSSGVLSINTTNNQAITLGTGLFTIAGPASASADFSVASSGWTSGDDYGPPLYVDVDTGNVGIGTTSPSAKLVVKGDMTASKVNKVIVVDGVTYSADGSGIQAAINALPAGGGKVFLPEGTYTISATLTLASNVTLEGAGHNATVLNLANGVNASVISASSATNIRIAHLKIDGNSGGNSGVHGIYFNNVDNSIVDHILLVSCDSDAFYIYSGSNNNIVADSRFESNSETAIRVDSSSYNTITNNNVISNGDRAIEIFPSATYNTIRGNIIDSNTGTAIHFCDNSHYNVVADNVIKSNTKGICFHNSSSNNTVSGNTIVSNTGYGIEFDSDGGDNNVITGNVLYDNGGSGGLSAINMDNVDDGSDNNIISGNFIYDSDGTGYAIYIAGSYNDNNVLVGNRITGFTWTSDKIYDAGTDTIYNAQLVGDHLILKSGGNVGIGTTTPSTKLSIVGTASISEDLWASGSFQFGGGITTATVSYSRLGTAATGHSLSNAYDLLISGNLEVDGSIYFDGTPIGDGIFTSNSIDFDEIVNNATLDADWIISGDYPIEFTKGSASEMFESLALKTDTLSNSTGTLTINAFTLGGDITGGGYDITGLTDLGAVHASISDDLQLVNNLHITTGILDIDGTASSTFAGDLDIEGDVNIGGGDLYVDASSGRVGIGTTSPDFVEGGGLNIVNATAPVLRLQDSNSVNSDWEIRSPSSASSLEFYHVNSANIDFAINKSTGVTYLNSGNVGIGTTDPGVKLDVAGQGRFESTVYPVVDIIRDSGATGGGIYGGAKLQRKTTSPTNGGGIGFFFFYPDSGGALEEAGMFGGALADTTAGSEIGEIVFAAAYHGVDPYNKRHLMIRAVDSTNGEVRIPYRLMVGADDSPDYTLSVDGTASISDDFWVTGDDVLFRPFSDSVDSFTISSSGFTAGDDYAIFSVDTTNERVGIGTTGPTAKLTIDNVGTDEDFGNSAIYIAEDAKYFDLYRGMVFRGRGPYWATRFTSTDLMDPDGEILGIYKEESVAGQTNDIPTASNEVIAIFRNDGTVGIGDTTPDAKFDVAGSGIFDEELIVGTNLHIGSLVSTSYVLSVDGTASISDTLYVENTFTVASGSNIHSGTLYVDADLNYVGIGTTAPMSKLSLGITANINNRIAIREAANGTYFYGVGMANPSGSIYGLGLYGGTEGSLPTDTNMHVFVENTGNVGIGDTTPDAMFDVAGSGIFDEELIVGTNLHIGSLVSTSYTLSVDGTASISDSFYVMDNLLEISNASVSFGGTGSVSFGGNLKLGTNVAISEPSTGHIRFENLSPSPNNNYFDIDLGEDWRYGVTLTTGGDGSIIRHDSDASMGDDKVLAFGSAMPTTLGLNTSGGDGNHVLRMTTSVGGASNASGYIYIADTSGSRYPTSNTENPTLRIYAASDTDVNDYLEFYHDQTNANLAWGNGNLIMTGGDVGIGDTDPFYTLSVDGTASISDQTFFMDDVLVVASNSMVGIGTTDPEEKLDIRVSGATQLGDVKIIPGAYGSIIRLSKSDEAEGATVHFHDYGAQDWYLGSPDSDIEGAGTEFYIGTSALGANAEFWIESDGNVGIGDTVPGAMLEIQDNDSSNYLFAVSSSSVGDLFNIASTGAIEVGMAGGGDVYIGESGNPANLIIDTGGNLGTLDGAICVGDDDASLCPGGSTDGTLYYDTDTASYDVAEEFKTKTKLEPGDLVIASDEKEFVELSSGSYNPRLIGVVATKPNILFRLDGWSSLGDKVDRTSGTSAPISLVGRVPVKVSTENGPIEVGDYLTSSTVPGHAMRACGDLEDGYFCSAGAVIGKALESFDSGQGKILVFMNLGQQQGKTMTAELIDFEDDGGGLTGVISDLFNGLKELGVTISNGVIKAVKLVVDVVETKVLRANTISITVEEGKDNVVGTAVIPAQSVEYRVENSLVEENSKIFITFTSDTGGRTWHISEKVAGAGFTIRLSGVTPEELEFDYWIVLVEETHANEDANSSANEDANPYCGDGELYAGEECDDGNVLDGDGCDATCMVEENDQVPMTNDQSNPNDQNNEVPVEGPATEPEPEITPEPEPEPEAVVEEPIQEAIASESE